MQPEWNTCRHLLRAVKGVLPSRLTRCSYLKFCVIQCPSSCNVTTTIILLFYISLPEILLVDNTRRNTLPPSSTTGQKNNNLLNHNISVIILCREASLLKLRRRFLLPLAALMLSYAKHILGPVEHAEMKLKQIFSKSGLTQDVRKFF